MAATIGRPPGSLNRRTIQRFATMRLPNGTDGKPIEPSSASLHKMQWWMRQYAEELARGAAASKKAIEYALDKAEEAAKALYPYVYARLSSIELDASVSVAYDLSKLTDEELDLLERLQSKIINAGAGPADGDPGGAGETSH